MTAKEFLKMLKTAVGDKPWPSKETLRDQIGIAFRAEAINRIKSRKLGEIDDKSSSAVKRELYEYGKALIKLLEVPDIDRLLFDRVMDDVIKNHNAVQSKEKRERAGLASKKRALDSQNQPKEEGASAMCQTNHTGGFSLGEALGQVPKS